MAGRGRRTRPTRPLSVGTADVQAAQMRVVADGQRAVRQREAAVLDEIDLVGPAQRARHVLLDIGCRPQCKTGGWVAIACMLPQRTANTEMGAIDEMSEVSEVTEVRDVTKVAAGVVCGTSPASACRGGRHDQACASITTGLMTDATPAALIQCRAVSAVSASAKSAPPWALAPRQIAHQTGRDRRRQSNCARYPGLPPAKPQATLAGSRA